MGIYLLLSIMPMVISLMFRDGNVNGDKKRPYCIICGAFLILVLGLRSKYLGSTDTQNYYNMMDSAIKASGWKDYYDEDGVEIGFQFFVFLLSRVFHHPQWIIFISTAIYVSSMFIFCYRYSDNVRLSITMYICLEIMMFNMQGMRQSIAMSICLFAYVFAEKKKLLPFAALIIVATLIHKTAILFSVVYLLSFIKLKPLHVFAVIIGIFVFVYFSQYLMGLANNFWGKEYTEKALSGGYVALSIYILIFAFCMIASKYPLKENIDSMMLYVLLIGFVSYAERYIGVRASERISFYFTFSQLILLPNTLENGKIDEKDKIVVEMIVYALCVLLFMYRLRTSNLIPFRFFAGGI
ncbi:MAG: EpsG family protein [Firmicutes bacterium]|nr:EpsG family protein [Bacillota bacterium]